MYETHHWDRVFVDLYVLIDALIILLRVWCVRSEVKCMWLTDCFMRLSMQQLAIVWRISRLEGVDYEESYVPCTLQSLLWLHLLVEWTTFLSVLVQCTECCDPLVLDCQDSLVIGFRGNLEIHSVTKGECEALHTSFDQYEISLMVEDHLCSDQSCTSDTVGTSNS